MIRAARAVAAAGTAVARAGDATAHAAVSRLAALDQSAAAFPATEVARLEAVEHPADTPEEPHGIAMVGAIVVAIGFDRHGAAAGAVRDSDVISPGDGLGGQQHRFRGSCVAG